MRALSISTLCLAFAAWLPCMRAQDTPSPGAAVSEMQKWIATTDEQWQAAFKRDVMDVHLMELEKLKQQYVAALDAAVTKASSAGELDGALALREEEKRFAGTNLLPEQDEATDGATVKQIRAAVRALIAKLEKDTAARTKALHAKYDQLLADAQAQLTRAQRLDDALLVKAKREQVAAAWGTPLAGGGVVFTPPAAQPTVSSSTPKPTPGTPAAATKPQVPFGAKPPGEVVIEALIDGNTTLHVKSDAIFWETQGASKPGLWDKHNEPTYVNGQSWVPRWRPKPRSGPETSFPTPVSLGTIDLECELLAVTDQRGQTGIQNRTPIEATIAAHEFIVRIPDKEKGAKWYKFALRPKKK